MVIAKENPIGLDVIVNKIQKAIQSKVTWSDKINIYPRCYPVLKENTRTIECYDGGNGRDYLNLITAEENKTFIVQSADSIRVDNNTFSTELELYVTIDLEEVFSAGGRRDTDAQRDIVNALAIVGQITVDRIVTRIERVFDGYTYKIKEDMQPYHCFKILIDVDYYNPNEKCCDC